MANSNNIVLPSEKYYSDCLGGLITHNSRQLDVAIQLDFVCKSLEADRKKDFKSLRSLFSFSGYRSWHLVPGVYLWGDVGRGKTYLMDLFYNSLSGTPKKRLHFHSFMQGIHDELREKSLLVDPLAAVADAWASSIRVVCLDEFQVTDITDAMLLGRLLANLFERGVTLIATSNEEPDLLYSDGLQREHFVPAIDLLKKFTTVVEIKGDTDYRLRALESAPVFYLGEVNEFTDSFMEIFLVMTGGNASLSEEIIVAGRAFKVRRAADGVIWASFKQLCMNPRSSRDYIEIGNLYHTMLLENIPILGREDEDAARRFINLIDELYDRKVNLIVSSVATPEMLYTGVRLAKPFERTASRLIEMRSTEYLSRPHRTA